MATLFPAMGAAQVQRSFVNASFEQPALVTPGCRVYIADAQVPGYATTHPAQAAQNVGGCVVPAGFNQTAPIMELWRTPRDNASGGTVNAPAGVQIAELNADVASRIYQSVCLINGETVSWRFLHRGRGSATAHDQAEFKLGAASTVVRVGTTNTGAFVAPVTSIGTSNAPVNVPGNATWVRYSGSFQYPNATGVTNLGFEAIGGTTSGNLLDDVQIDVRPFIEFTQSNSSTPESASDNRPTLRVNGTAFQDIVVTIQITGGTATLGTDYTTPTGTNTFTVTIPGSAAGIVYDGTSAASLFPLPVTIVNDTLVESNETIVFGIVAPTGTPLPFLLNSSAVCGGAAQTSWIYTIVDDDSGITLLKNSAPPVPVAGQPDLFDIVYTILVSNPSATIAANYSLTDAPGFDADVAVQSASYTFNGGAATTLSGSGPWTLRPQWQALPAGQTHTFVLTVRGRVARGGSVANDACTDPSTGGNGLHNVANAVLQGSGGNPDTNYSDNACETTPTPAWVILRTHLLGRAAATDQAQVRIYAAGTVAATATTTGTAVPATAATALLVVPAGTTLQFDEAIKTNGTGADRSMAGYRPGIVCTSAGAPVAGLPSGTGSDAGTRQIWPDFTGVAGADVDCTITNMLVQADLRITKTNTPGVNGDVDQAADTVASGATTTYTVRVTNAGPDAADGAVVRDVPGTGLTGCNVVPPGCTGTSGATCPAAPGDVLATAGVAIPVLPAGATVAFTIACTVQ